MALIALNARGDVICLYCPPFWDWFPLFVLSWTMWGAVGSLLLPGALTVRDALATGVLIEGRMVFPLVLIVALGAACAAGTLRVARQSPIH